MNCHFISVITRFVESMPSDMFSLGSYYGIVGACPSGTRDRPFRDHGSWVSPILQARFASVPFSVRGFPDFIVPVRL